MGREIRKVPANWQHPTRDPEHDTYRHGGLQPMFDETYEAAVVEWKAGLAKWEAGERPSYFDAAAYPSGCEYWEWEGPPPIRAYYRPWEDNEATWFQVWETVSEGTPVSPPFPTEEELIQYLAENGDFWDQKRCRDRDAAQLFGMKYGVSGWGREAAERFVKGKWAPSMVMVDGDVVDGKLYAG